MLECQILKRKIEKLAEHDRNEWKKRKEEKKRKMTIELEKIRELTEKIKESTENLIEYSKKEPFIEKQYLIRDLEQHEYVIIPHHGDGIYAVRHPDDWDDIANGYLTVESLDIPIDIEFTITLEASAKFGGYKKRKIKKVDLRLKNWTEVCQMVRDKLRKEKYEHVEDAYFHESDFQEFFNDVESCLESSDDYDGPCDSDSNWGSTRCEIHFLVLSRQNIVKNKHESIF